MSRGSVVRALLRSQPVRSGGCRTRRGGRRGCQGGSATPAWTRHGQRAHLSPRLARSPEMAETRFSPPRGAFESASVAGSIESDVSRIWGSPSGWSATALQRPCSVPQLSIGPLSSYTRAHASPESPPATSSRPRVARRVVGRTRVVSHGGRPASVACTSDRAAHLGNEDRDVVRRGQIEAEVAVAASDSDELQQRRRWRESARARTTQLGQW